MEICLAVLSSLGLQHVLSQTHNIVLKRIFICFLFIFAFFEMRLINMPYTVASEVPEKHLSVLENAGNYSMLEIPFGFRGNVYETLGSHDTGMSFYYQMKHHIPIIGGYMSMIDWKSWSTIKADSLMQKLITCQETKACESMTEEDKERFSNVYKIKYVTVLNRNYYYLRKYLSDEIGLVKIYEDELVTVWQNTHVGSN